MVHIGDILGDELKLYSLSFKLEFERMGQCYYQDELCRRNKTLVDHKTSTDNYIVEKRRKL